MGQAIPRARSAPAPATVLVADDSELNRSLYRRLLERRGYLVVEARDGCEALEEIERGPPDLVLLDLRMPRITGTEVLRHVRREHDAVDLPIIILTGETDTDIAANCLAAGANDYITKPILWSVLRARLETHLRLHHVHAELMNYYSAEEYTPEEMRAD